MQTFYTSALLAVASQAISMQVDQVDSVHATFENQIGRDGDNSGNPGLIENVNVDEDAIGDEQSRPLCAIGGHLDEPDTEGPSAPCCRVYEDNDYKGLYYDFCHYGDADDMTDRYYKAEFFGWHNEINSFQCGQDVGIVLCAHPDDADGVTDDMDRKSTCIGGNDNVVESYDQNPNLGDTMPDEGGNNVHDSIWIVKQKHECSSEYNNAVVYSGLDCTGRSMFASALAWAKHHEDGDPDYVAYKADANMEQAKGSWTHYGQNIEFNQQRLGKSVYLPTHFEFEIYEGDENGNSLDFASIQGNQDVPAQWEWKGHESYTIRNTQPCKTEEGEPVEYTCYNFPERYWRNDNTTQTNDIHMQAHGDHDGTKMAVPAFKIRQQWMPTI